MAKQTAEQVQAADVAMRSFDVLFEGENSSSFVQCANGWRATEAGYGWVVEPDHKECAFAIQYACRQDGRTSWVVVLTMCDGDAKVKSGLSPSGMAHSDILRAMHELTVEGGWLQWLRVRSL